MFLAGEHVREVELATKGKTIAPSRGRHLRGCGSEYETPAKPRRSSASSSASAAEITELRTQQQQQDDVISSQQQQIATQEQEIATLKAQQAQNLQMMRFFHEQLRAVNPNTPPFDPSMFSGSGPSSGFLM